jgi:hypothetical protein
MKVFDIVEGKVALTPEVLLLPETQVIVDKYKKDAISALSYVYFMTDPHSPYSELDERIKSDVVARDFPGKWNPRDLEIQIAVNAMREKYGELPEDRMLRAAKIAADMAAEELQGIADTVKGDIKALEVLFKILEKIGGPAKALSEARAARDKAHASEQKVRGGKARGIY